MSGLRGCPGHCAMHHECPCADKLERHPSDGVADTPGTTRSPDAVAGRQLEEAIRRLSALLVRELFHPGSTGL